MVCEQVKAKKCWLLKPSVRLNRVMARVSRDKYLSSDDVLAISHRIAKKLSSSWATVIKHGIPETCEAIGMIRGRPPVRLFDPDYAKFLRLNKKNHSGASLEYQALLIFIGKSS